MSNCLFVNFAFKLVDGVIQNYILYQSIELIIELWPWPEIDPYLPFSNESVSRIPQNQENLQFIQNRMALIYLVILI